MIVLGVRQSDYEGPIPRSATIRTCTLCRHKILLAPASIRRVNAGWKAICNHCAVLLSLGSFQVELPTAVDMAEGAQ